MHDLNMLFQCKITKEPGREGQAREKLDTNGSVKVSLLFNFLLCSDVPDTWSPMHAGGGGDH